MDNSEKNEMTLEDLAAMVAEGFVDISGRMATKSDIANMATKDDIANMATKDDIANMATKDDLAALEKKMMDGFAEQSFRIDFIRKELAEVKTALNELSKRVLEDNNAFNSEIIKLKVRVETLEARIKLLEPKSS